MKPIAIALVAPPDSARVQIATYLRDRGYEVQECDDLTTATRLFGVVILDRHDGGETARARVQSWSLRSKPVRVVVISATPVRWRALQLLLGEHLAVIPVPAFGWEVVDALRGGPRRV